MILKIRYQNKQMNFTAAWNGELLKIAMEGISHLVR